VPFSLVVAVACGLCSHRSIRAEHFSITNFQFSHAASVPSCSPYVSRFLHNILNVFDPLSPAPSAGCIAGSSAVPVFVAQAASLFGFRLLKVKNKKNPVALNVTRPRQIVPSKRVAPRA
jgi:hypothetical protein